MADPCVNCPGGENHIHEINPNWEATEIVLADDGRALFPRPLRPENICLNKLANVDVDAEPIDAPAGVFPMVWDSEACEFVLASWPCPEMVEWDRTTDSAPADPCIDCAEDGVTRYAREVNTGCISHICIGGAWVCVGGELPVGEQVDFICYDLSSWVFPATFSGGVGASSTWSVFGSNVMDNGSFECTDGYTTFENAQVDYACWNDPGSYLQPSQGGYGTWNDLAWAVDSISPGAPDSILATGAPANSHGCPRPAFRIDPGFPVGASGPLQWTFDMLQISGSTRFAAYDLVTGKMLPINSFTQPAGPTQGTQNTNIDYLPSDPRKTVLSTNAGPLGTYSIEFALPSGALSENVRFLAYNMGGVNSDAEEFSALSNAVVVPNSVCCFEWANIGALSTWLNQNDPNGLQWIVDGTCVCAEAPVGLGSNYGELASCGDSSSPIVTPDAPNCP